MPGMPNTSSSNLVLVTGGGGFIGGHLVAELLRRAQSVRAVDMQAARGVVPALRRTPRTSSLDLSLLDACREAVARARARSTTSPPTWAAWASSRTTRPLCMLSVLINTHMLHGRARRRRRALLLLLLGLRLRRRQAGRRRRSPPLKEADAYPAMPEDGYGWEKLFSERMCRHFREDFGLETRVARYHNVYGPHGTWTAAARRRRPRSAARSPRPKLTGRHEIEIWGDGDQTRSFMYIDDCVEGHADDRRRRRRSSRSTSAPPSW